MCTIHKLRGKKIPTNGCIECVLEYVSNKPKTDTITAEELKYALESALLAIQRTQLS